MTNRIFFPAERGNLVQVASQIVPPTRMLVFQRNFAFHRVAETTAELGKQFTEMLLETVRKNSEFSTMLSCSKGTL